MAITAASQRGPLYRSSSLVARERVNGFIKRHNLAWELTFGLLAVVYLGLSFTADSGGGAAFWVIGAVGAIFVGEFSLRMWAAESRLRYLGDHWLDLVSCIPLIGGLRSLRLLRLVRVVSALRVLNLADRAGRTRGGRQSFWYLGPLVLTMWLIAAVVYWSFEYGINPAVHHFGDALYWAGITAATVGNAGVAPVTIEGQILSGALIFVGIGLIGFISTRLTTRWLKVDDGVAALGSRIASLEHEISMLREVLVARHGDDVSAPSELRRAESRADTELVGSGARRLRT